GISTSSRTTSGRVSAVTLTAVIESPASPTIRMSPTAPRISRSPSLKSAWSSTRTMEMVPSVTAGPVGRSLERYVQLDQAAAARPAGDGDPAAEQRGPLPHGGQAHTAVLARGRRVEALSVVLHRGDQRVRCDVHADEQGGRAGVGEGVARRLADDEERLVEAPRLGPGLVAVDVEPDAHGAAVDGLQEGQQRLL